MVVIDFGTATTFDVLTGKGELIGVVIAPGIKTALEGLVSNTAQLPMIELVAPKSVIAKSTQECMQAGVIFGFAGLVENIVKKIKNELNVDEISVIATGGMGEIIAKELHAVNYGFVLSSHIENTPRDVQQFFGSRSHRWRTHY